MLVLRLLGGRLSGVVQGAEVRKARECVGKVRVQVAGQCPNSNNAELVQSEIAPDLILKTKWFGRQSRPNSQPLLKFKAEIFPNYFDLGILMKGIHSLNSGDLKYLWIEFSKRRPGLGRKVAFLYLGKLKTVNVSYKICSIIPGVFLL